MSRVTVTGKKYEIAFGVDRTTGVFVQVWSTPSAEQDAAILKIDNFGVYRDEHAMKEFPNNAQQYILQLEQQLKNHPGHHIGEEHIIELARRLEEDFPDVTRDVYRVFGDDV